MTKTLVFLLEEPSMREVLEILLPKILPHEIEFKLIVHDGKQELEKYIPIRLGQWKTPNTYFIVVRDQNSSDCIKLKQRLKLLKCGIATTILFFIIYQLSVISYQLSDKCTLRAKTLR